MLDGYDVVAPAVPPPHLLDWDNFVTTFEARWTDPHKANKAMDKIMRGLIIQKTSVKIYNDQFNEAMGLAGLTGANTAIDCAYVIGLKGPIRQAAIAPQMAALNMTFTEKQSLMVRIDEMLMQTQPRTQNTRNTNTAPQQGRAQSTAPRGQTPIKVEASRTYTKLTDGERDYLRRNGGCFRCRKVPAPGEPGHLAKDCKPGQQITATTTPIEPALAPDPKPLIDLTAPALDF